MYSTYNEKRFVVAERFIKTLKKKIFKHMTPAYFDVLDNIVNKYSNTVHRTIKMKSIAITSNSYVEHNEDSNKKILNLKLVIVLEFQIYKKIFAKGYTPNWSEEDFIVRKIKNIVLWTYAISGLNGKVIGASS